MRWLTRKKLQGRFEEHNLKVSCLYPEVHDRLKKQTFPAPLNSFWDGKNLFWSIKNSDEILNKLKSRGFLASGLSTYDFSTLYTTLPHNLIKEKLTELMEQTFNREG